MNRNQAAQLQNRIQGILPRVSIDVYRLGNGEYTCHLDKYFHIWDEEDWNRVALLVISRYRKKREEEETYVC